MNTKVDKNFLVEKIKREKPYMADVSVKTIAEGLGNLPPPLNENLTEWVNGRPLTDYLIRGKYNVNTVLKIRNSKDVIFALLDLARYADSEENEFMLWQTRM